MHQTYKVVFLLFDGHLTAIFDATKLPQFWVLPICTFRSKKILPSGCAYRKEKASFNTLLSIKPVADPPPPPFRVPKTKTKKYISAEIWSRMRHLMPSISKFAGGALEDPSRAYECRLWCVEIISKIGTPPVCQVLDLPLKTPKCCGHLKFQMKKIQKASMRQDGNTHELLFQFASSQVKRGQYHALLGCPDPMLTQMKNNVNKHISYYFLHLNCINSVRPLDCNWPLFSYKLR